MRLSTWIVLITFSALVLALAVNAWVQFIGTLLL